MESLASELQEIVRAASLPQGIQACAYRIVDDEALGSFIELVLVLEAETWTEQAVEVCEQASIKLGDAARNSGYSMSFFCRTSGEHASAMETEGNVWTPVDVSVAC